MLDAFTEISGVCTHPLFRAQGMAARLMWRVIEQHRREGIVSGLHVSCDNRRAVDHVIGAKATLAPILHVSCDNRRAVDLYRRMGFEITQQLVLNRISANR